MTQSLIIAEAKCFSWWDFDAVTQWLSQTHKLLSHKRSFLISRYSTVALHRNSDKRPTKHIKPERWHDADQSSASRKVSGSVIHRQRLQPIRLTVRGNDTQWQSVSERFKSFSVLNTDVWMRANGSEWDLGCKSALSKALYKNSPFTIYIVLPC